MTVVLKDDPDIALTKAMHGKSVGEKNAFFAMLKKDRAAHREVINEYICRWNAEVGTDATSDEAREERRSEYTGLVNKCELSPLPPHKHYPQRRGCGLLTIDDDSYYDLATDFYEEAWGQSFHFCRFTIGEPFLQALARHEHYLAYKLGIEQGMEVLDVGCGVGGPAREIARFTGCQVVGINNNGYQIARAARQTQRAGLDDRVSFFKGNFMVRREAGTRYTYPLTRSVC